MNLQALQQQIEILSWRMAAAELVAFIVGMVVLYYVLKLAIRDGIREAMPKRRFFEPTSSRSATPPEAPPGYQWKLVKAEDFQSTDRQKL